MSVPVSAKMIITDGDYNEMISVILSAIHSMSDFFGDQAGAASNRERLAFAKWVIEMCAVGDMLKDPERK